MRLYQQYEKYESKINEARKQEDFNDFNTAGFNYQSSLINPVDESAYQKINIETPLLYCGNFNIPVT